MHVHVHAFEKPMASQKGVGCRKLSVTWKATSVFAKPIASNMGLVASSSWGKIFPKWDAKLFLGVPLLCGLGAGTRPGF